MSITKRLDILSENVHNLALDRASKNPYAYKAGYLSELLKITLECIEIRDPAMANRILTEFEARFIPKVKRKIETFRCATGAGWGILVDNLMNCDLPYVRTEQEAFWNGTAAYPDEKIYTTADLEHYSNEGLDVSNKELTR